MSEYKGSQLEISINNCNDEIKLKRQDMYVCNAVETHEENPSEHKFFSDAHFHIQDKLKKIGTLCVNH